MKNSKRLLALGAAALMTATLFAGCGSSSDSGSASGSDASTDEGGASGASYKIAVVPKMTSIGWFQRMEEGVTAYNAANGTDYTYTGPTEGADQAAYVEQLLADDWDAICVVPFDSNSLAPVLQKAKEAGIVVITHEAASMDPQYFDYDVEAFVNADYGTNFAKELVELTGGEGTYVQFVGDLNSVSHNEWCDAADAYFAANSNMTKLGRYETGDDETSAYNQTKELLQQNPGITAIEGSASTDVKGAARDVEELGLAGQVAIVGTSMTSISGEYVEDGTIASFSVWDPAEAGKAMIELAIAVLDNGGTIDVASTSLNADGYATLTADESVPTVLYGSARVDVTAENMADYDF
jgi:simple sugar transport system substrate-binding protein